MLLKIQEAFFYHPISRFYLPGLIILGKALTFSDGAASHLKSLELNDSFLYFKFLLLASLALVYSLLTAGINYCMERTGSAVMNFHRNNIFKQFLNLYCAMNLFAVYMFVFYFSFLLAPLTIKGAVAYWGFVLGAPVILLYLYAFASMLYHDQKRRA